MPDTSTNRDAEPVIIDHSMRTLDGLDWNAGGTQIPIVIASDTLSADALAPFAERVVSGRRVVGIKANSHWDPITTSWWVGQPVVLLAQGAAGKLACQTALAAPGSIHALVLADYAPEPGDTSHSGIAVPTLVFHGRQSDTETHAQAVRLHEEIPNSHLIEPESCGAEPTRTCAEPLAAALEWFLAELGKPYMQFGNGGEPVDPRG